MKKTFTFAYGSIVYVYFLAIFLYLIGFLANVPGIKTIDSGEPGDIWVAVVADVLLLAFFGVQHSVMARRGFKAWWTRIVPAPIERSTFVLATSLVLTLLVCAWEPIVDPIWTVTDDRAAAMLEAVFWLGWVILLVSTFLINHFELFGLRQVFARLFDRPIPEPTFRTPVFYRYVRHPIYLGFLLAFWATPAMTFGHLVFAIVATLYILIGIAFEERDLIAQFGDRYRDYKTDVGMLLPRLGGRRTTTSATTQRRPS